MIAPMRMVTVVCHQPDAASALLALRDVGVVHLLPVRVRPSADLETTRKQHERALAALALLPSEVASGAAPAPGDDAVDAEALALELQQLGATRQRIEQSEAELRAERDALLPFGDFDPAEARALSEHGIELKLYLLPHKSPAPDAPPGSAVQVVGDTEQGTAVVLVGPKGAALAAREQPLPARSLGAVITELAEHARRRAEVEARLQALAPRRGALQAHAARLAEAADLLEARAGMAEEPDLCWLEGAIPAASVPSLEAAAAAHGWATSVREPGPDDRVPTLLESPKWVRQVHSVLTMLGITPGYGEPDSSPLFLVFLVLFAGMLIGDAGYGSLLLAATLVLGRGRETSQPVRLLRTIAVATIVWGALTNNWFAIPTAKLPGFLSGLQVTWLTDPLLASKHVMLLCFFIGALHLTLAHGWAAILARKSLAALAQLGWIACTWFMFAIARQMVLGDAMPSVMWSVLIAGVALIVVFMTPLAKLKDEWFNHVMLPLSLVSNFVDVVSYLRLFAVGTAGYAVAASFNAMAAKAAEGGGLGWLVAALIVVFGHSLNLALCAMGVLVHGVRLNTLEFSAHLGLQWNGFNYRPFARHVEAASAGPGTTRNQTSEE